MTKRLFEDYENGMAQAEFMDISNDKICETSCLEVEENVKGDTPVVPGFVFASALVTQTLAEDETNSDSDPLKLSENQGSNVLYSPSPWDDIDNLDSPSPDKLSSSPLHYPDDINLDGVQNTNVENNSDWNILKMKICVFWYSGLFLIVFDFLLNLKC